MAGLFNPPSYYRGTILGNAIKRKVFFSFHYDDIMRVNVVRNAWKISHPEAGSTRGFYDGSLWESKKLTGDESVKNLIREGVQNTSAVCVLIGALTCVRRWVRYEIARAVIDERGLLAVHLNSIKHHKTLTPHTHGYDPLLCMGIQKVQETLLSVPQYYLVEYNSYTAVDGSTQWRWEWYKDYTQAVPKPKWLPDPIAGQLKALSAGARTYDYIGDQGHNQIGSWIDNAAIAAGR